MKTLESEIFYRTARSGGSGGQNVNKVETMAEAWWHVASSKLVSNDEKELITAKLSNRINKEGYIIFKSSETRSQLENKLIAREKLEKAIARALVVPKKRKASKPGKAAIEKRLDSKRRESEKKMNRRGNW